MNSKEALEKILNHKCYEKESSCWDYVKTLFQEEVATIEKDLDRLEVLEKELKQTKLNFGNSQTHSKNCYKKLKGKYVELEKENRELKKVRDNYSDQLNYVWNIVNSLKDENTKLKQAIEILKENLHISLVEEPIYPNCANYYINQYNKFGNGCLTIITQENFDLLKEVI